MPLGDTRHFANERFGEDRGPLGGGWHGYELWDNGYRRESGTSCHHECPFKAS